LVAAKLAERLGQPIIIDNVPGKGGNDGTALAAKAAPDGYTLLLGLIGPLVVHQFTYTSRPFHPERDFVPIALLESSPMLLLAASSAPVASARELIDLARAQPGNLSYASSGSGSPEQVAGELFKTRLKIDLHHIPYDGAGPARKAVLAGQAALMFDPCKGALPRIREGQQKPLAVAAANRLTNLPQVPTFAEVGLRDHELRIWTGVLAPAGAHSDGDCLDTERSCPRAHAICRHHDGDRGGRWSSRGNDTAELCGFHQVRAQALEGAGSRERCVESLSRDGCRPQHELGPTKRHRQT
jgi:tripartite-type tricarboxylate transporter receptor subunit TctC